MLQTVAETGQGLDALTATLQEHADWLERSGEGSRRRRSRLAGRVRQEVDRTARRRLWSPAAEALLADALDALEHGETSPYEVASRIVDRAFAVQATESDPRAGGTEGGRSDIDRAADTSQAGVDPWTS